MLCFINLYIFRNMKKSMCCPSLSSQGKLHRKPRWNYYSTFQSRFRFPQMTSVCIASYPVPSPHPIGLLDSYSSDTQMTSVCIASYPVPSPHPIGLLDSYSSDTQVFAWEDTFNWNSFLYLFSGSHNLVTIWSLRYLSLIAILYSLAYIQKTRRFHI